MVILTSVYVVVKFLAWLVQAILSFTEYMLLYSKYKTSPQREFLDFSNASSGSETLRVNINARFLLYVSQNTFSIFQEMEIKEISHFRLEVKTMQLISVGYWIFSNQQLH